MKTAKDSMKYMTAKHLAQVLVCDHSINTGFLLLANVSVKQKLKIVYTLNYLKNYPEETAREVLKELCKLLFCITYKSKNLKAS